MHVFVKTELSPGLVVTGHAHGADGSLACIRGMRERLSGGEPHELPQSLAYESERALALQWLADSPSHGLGGAYLARVLNALTSTHHEA